MTGTMTKPTDKKTKWTADSVTAAIRRWVELYGEPPRSSDWNPSSAKWSGQTWRIPRYQAGDPETGAAWPSLNAAKTPFGGSLNAAVIAAGFEPAKSGPKRRGAGPVVDRADAPPTVLRAMEDLQASVRALEAKLATREALVGRLRARLEAAPKKEVKPKVETKTVVREVRVADKAAVDRVRARAEKNIARALEARDRAREDADVLRRELAALARASKKQEEAHGKLVARMRSDLEEAREVAGQVQELERQLSSAESVGDALRAEVERARREADAARGRVVVRDSPEAAAVDAALEEARVARREAREADARAAAADRAYAEVAQAVSGEPRRLTRDEVQALRAKGPAGPAVLAKALGKVAAARKTGGRQGLRLALRELASAAVSWDESL